ncbi:MAG TPA: ABC transporter permease [Candidatus Bathyarchaeia archaeon]|nr:ABC transporter permease [Candidatus Bathyarchaeia archaeon]
MTIRQGTCGSQNRRIRNGRSSAGTTSRVVKKKKNRNLKQIFVLSIDSLRERKVRSALTILMVVVGGALMVAINAISAGFAAFMDKQIGSLSPNVFFVGPGSKSKTFQEVPGLATMTPRLPFNHQVVNTLNYFHLLKMSYRRIRVRFSSMLQVTMFLEIH